RAGADGRGAAVTPAASEARAEADLTPPALARFWGLAKHVFGGVIFPSPNTLGRGGTQPCAARFPIRARGEGREVEDAAGMPPARRDPAGTSSCSSRWTPGSPAARR